MNQRVAKVESVIREVVAMELAERLERDSAAVTVTRVDAAPDLRNATVWIGLLGDAGAQDRVWTRVEAERSGMQAAVSKKMMMKYVPRLQLKRDSGGEYAQRIDELLKGV